MTQAEKEFRESKFQGELGLFLSSPTGRQLLYILERESLPKMQSKKQYGNKDDVQFQMSINLVDSLAKQEIVELIRSLSLPIKQADDQGFEPLEDDSYEVPEYQPEKKKKVKIPQT